MTAANFLRKRTILLRWFRVTKPSNFPIQKSDVHSLLLANCAHIHNCWVKRWKSREEKIQCHCTSILSNQGCCPSGQSALAHTDETKCACPAEKPGTSPCFEVLYRICTLETPSIYDYRRRAGV